MRGIVIGLALLAAPGVPALAGMGQDQLADPKAAVEQVFWPKLYGNGGTTLYCGKPFTSSGSELTASAVYTVRQIKSALRCMTDNQCQVVNPRFHYMLADLHNLYPELTRVELARRGETGGDEVGDRALAVLRPEKLSLAPQSAAGQPNVFKGRLQRSIYLGAFSEYVVAFGDRQFFVQSMESPEIAEGDDVYMAVDKAKLRLLAEEDA